jgi:RNA polymerase sigma-70 factor (ECF subfamily)
VIPQLNVLQQTFSFCRATLQAAALDCERVKTTEPKELQVSTTTATDGGLSDTICIERLYQIHQRPLVAYLARLVRDHTAAEDLCQETFLKAIRGWAGRRSAGTTTAWLYRIAANTAYDHLRRRRAAGLQLCYSDRLLSDAPAPEPQLDAAELVRQTLEQMPARYRLPLVMYVCQGYSLGEIAAALDCSYDAVKMRLFRARECFQRVYHG